MKARGYIRPEPLNFVETRRDKIEVGVAIYETQKLIQAGRLGSNLPGNQIRAEINESCFGMFSQRLLNRRNRVWQDLIIVTQQPHPISGGMNKAERDVSCQTDPNRM